MIGADGYEVASRTVPFKDGAFAAQEFRLPIAEGIVKGRVTHADGTPATDVAVSVSGKATRYHTTTTDKDGRFVLSNIAANERLRLQALQFDQPIAETQARTGDDKVEIVLGAAKEDL